MTIKVRWKPLLFLVLFSLVAYGGYRYWDKNIKIVPEVLLQRALERIEGVESYRYRVDLRLVAGGYDRYISAVNGVRAGRDAFFLEGTIEGTPIEAYHIDGTTYLRTGDQEKWMTIPGNEVFEQELFMVEIDPLASFKFSAVKEFSYRGTAKIDGQKLHILFVKPELDHPFMTKHWRDFEYLLYVKRNGELVRGEISAVLKAKPSDTMHLVVEIKDHNAKIELVPPVS
ncbi:MAG TPA: hypothetical protein GX504_10255 [Clostridia bacterium]|nr:hypothetical protein [Clostridia bacterium]